VRDTFVGRSVKTIRTKIVGIGVTRSQRHWRIEIDRVSASNVVSGNVTVATEEAPIAIGSSGNGIDARKTDEIVGLVKVGVIHRHIDGVGTVLIDVRKPAVAEVNAVPGNPGSKQIVRAVILRAANRKVLIRGMHRHAHELSSPETGVIETGPGDAGVD
jgi:hypothetical protein